MRLLPRRFLYELLKLIHLLLGSIYYAALDYEPRVVLLHYRQGL